MLTALVVGLTVVVALLGLLVAGLLRSHAEILRQLHALGAGRSDDGTVATAAGAVDAPFTVRPDVVAPPARAAVPAHDVGGVSLTGDAIAIGVVGAPQHTLLAFLSSGCSTCARFWDAFGKDSLGLPTGVRLVVVVKDVAEESIWTLRGLAPKRVPVVMSSAAWDAYGVPGSPFFVLVDGPGGRVVGEGAATSWPQVLDLMKTSFADAAPHLVGRAADDRDNAARIDAELQSAGIHPGDPSLYPDTAR